jgi:hypothetical protein
VVAELSGTIECDSCGRHRPHKGRDWCGACHSRWLRADCPDTGPPPPRNGRYEEYYELTREQHYTLANAAARMGICERTAYRYEARIAKAGTGRSTYQSGRLGVLVTRPAAFSTMNGQEVA